MMPISVNKFLISQRNAGYTITEAIAELADNSIQAEADYFKIDKVMEGKNVTKFIFSDNGCGMPFNTLHKYLVMGESSNWLSNSFIGKFGVGAKVSAYCQCLKITVFSRVKGTTEYYSTSYDLEVVMGSNEIVGISEPVVSELPQEVSLFVRDDANTIVIWEKFDLLAKRSSNAMDNDIRCDLGRMFRRFIYAGFDIEYNGQKVKAFDPTFQLRDTYNNEVLTKAYLGEHANTRHYEPQYFAQDFVLASDGNEKVTLTVTLMPNEVTRTPGKGGDQLAKALRLKQNQGKITYLRAGREIGYDSFHNCLGRAAIAEDRFIGIEIKFNGHYDDEFGTKMIKRGVEPTPSMKKRIIEALKTYVPIANKALRQRWSGASENIDFEAAEKAVENLETMFNAISSSESKSAEKIAERMSKLLTLAKEVGIQDQQEYLERKSSRPFVIEEVESLINGTLLDFEANEQQILIRINQNHSIYRSVWLPMHKISAMSCAELELMDASQTAKHSLQALNLMIIAFAKMNEEQDVSAFMGDWSGKLETLIRQVEVSQ